MNSFAMALYCACWQWPETSWQSDPGVFIIQRSEIFHSDWVSPLKSIQYRVAFREPLKKRKSRKNHKQTTEDSSGNSLGKHYKGINPFLFSSNFHGFRQTKYNKKITFHLVHGNFVWSLENKWLCMKTAVIVQWLLRYFVLRTLN